MYTMKNIIEEMEALKGANVRIFGQPVTLPEDTDKTTVDIIDILKNLKEYEITELYGYRFNNETEEDEEIDILEDCENSDDIISVLVDYGYINDDCDYKGDNSYNWGGNVSHDFDIKIYNNAFDGGVFVEFKAHRFGDVRGNYTESVILQFDNAYTFWECIEECDKYESIEVDGKTYNYTVSALSDTYEVTDEEGNYICEAYGEEDDIIEAIKKAEETQ